MSIIANPESAPLEINSPEQLLNQAQIIQPSDDKYIKHPLFKNMDNPHIPLYFDLSQVTISGTDYQEPLFLPLHNADGELKQVAVMQLDKVTSIICESKPLAFALLGDYNKDKPLIIEYDLANAFRLLACGYPVALAVFKECLSDCPRTALADWQCNVIASVVNQLKRAGYQQLYVISYPQAYPKIHAPLDKALAAHPVQFINMELPPYGMDFSEVKEIINTAIAQANNRTEEQTQQQQQVEVLIDRLHDTTGSGGIVIPPYILNTVIGKLSERVAHCAEMPLGSVFSIMLAGASAACATNYKTCFQSNTSVALGIYAVAEQPPSTAKNLVLGYATGEYQKILGGHNKDTYEENEEGAKKPYSFVIESDATSAALDKKLADCQSGRFVIASAEQEAFSTLFPSESVSYLTSIGLVLNGWGGEYYSCSRSGRQSYSGDVWGTILTFAQSGSIAKVLNASSGRGLSERFLFAAEESLLGKRTLDKGYVSELDRVDFNNSVRSCLSRYLKKKEEYTRLGKIADMDLIKPSQAGYELILNKRREIEPLLGELNNRGETVYLGWLGKIETHVLKIASVLHIFEHEHKTLGVDVIEELIPDELIQYTIELVSSWGEHIRQVIQENGQSGEKAEIEAIIDILSERKYKKSALIQKAKRRKPFKTHDYKASYYRVKRSIEKMIEQKIIMVNDKEELELS